MKYYVVWEGNATGIFDNWTQCSESIKGYRGAIYKSFKSLAEAEEAFQNDPLLYIGKTTEETEQLKNEDIRIVIGEPFKGSISTGGYYDFERDTITYRGVDIDTDAVVFKKADIQGGNLLLCRFLPIVHALAYLNSKSIDAPVYTTNKQVVYYIRNDWYDKLFFDLDPKSEAYGILQRAILWLSEHEVKEKVLLWDQQHWGEMPGAYKRRPKRHRF